MKKSTKNKNNTGDVMRSVASSIDFIKSQIAIDLMTAKNKNMIELDVNQLKKIANIIDASIASSFIKTAGQIESSLQ
jgi:hypothetical protein